MILFYLIPLYLSNAIPLENDNAGAVNVMLGIPLENDNAGAVNVMLDKTNLASRGGDRLHDPDVGRRKKWHDEHGACEDKQQFCASLRQESKINPQGLDYCFMPGYIDKMRGVCLKTCGYCDPPELPECAKTEYGCCWDKKTIKLTSDGSNCPDCTNSYAYACETFHQDCSSAYKPGEFMHQYCPATCELCDGNWKCMDDRLYIRGLCSFWKTEFGWCNSFDRHFDIMRFFCPATCELC